MSLLLQDPWFNAMVDEAVSEHGNHFTRRQIDAFRKALAFTFETNPKARRMLAVARPDLDRRLSESAPN